MELIEVSVSAENEVYQIELIGELDACSSIVLDQVLEEAGIHRPHQVLIDCQKLTYISSAGLGAIIAHLEDYRIYNINLTMFNVQSTVQNICELVGLNKYISICSQPAQLSHSANNSKTYHMSSDGDNT